VHTTNISPLSLGGWELRLLELWLLVVVILHLTQVLAVSSFVVPFNIFQSLPLLPEFCQSHGLGFCLGAVACRFKLVRNHFSHGHFVTSDVINAIKAHALHADVLRLRSLVAPDASDASVLAHSTFYEKKLDQK
jgi:hypothetical protein